jgi:hypothetical protein
MATFVHMADARLARRIVRGGIHATDFWALPEDGRPRRGVFCVPVTADFQMTYQWLRELKRRGHRTACGIQFRVGDAEAVFVGRYHQWPQQMTATQSVEFFHRAMDARGLQVVVPRAILAREITAVRSVPQVTGWRFYPSAKGSTPWRWVHGEINAARLRHRIERLNRSPLER